MRLIHTSDLHLGSPLSSRYSPQKARTRRLELQETLSRLADEAKRQRCEGIIIAGDLFDADNPSALDEELFLSTVRRHNDLMFFYLQGNHDAKSQLQNRALPENLYLFGEKLTEYKIGGVTIVGKTVLGKNTFSDLKLDRKQKNIVVLHGALGDGADGGIKLSDAAYHGIDYLALGHYHSFSETRIDERGICVYSGTPEGRGFDEAHECGYVLIDAGSKLEYRFIPFAKRRIMSIEVDISHALSSYDVESLVRNSLGNVSNESIVRIILSGNRSDGLIYDTKYLCDVFGDSFFYFEIKDISVLKIPEEELAYDKSLIGEFLRVCNEAKLEPELSGRVTELGLRVLRGDKI